VWLGVGGALGVVLALVLALGGPRLLAQLEATNSDDEAMTDQLPLALDLLGACLAGGGVLHDAVVSVAGAVPDPCGERLRRVAASLVVGSPAGEAFKALGDDRGAGGAAARALSRAADGGIPVAAAVTRVAEEARRTALVAARKRAKRAGVRAVGPLTACFLPAFISLGVVPLVIGLLGSALRGL
jgi:Flp pilus assembly protein TadB